MHHLELNLGYFSDTNTYHCSKLIMHSYVRGVIICWKLEKHLLRQEFQDSGFSFISQIYWCMPWLLQTSTDEPLSLEKTIVKTWSNWHVSELSYELEKKAFTLQDDQHSLIFKHKQTLNLETIKHKRAVHQFLSISNP